MLIGATANTIDEKGRLTLAAKWRTELASGVVITRGVEKCLFIFPKNQFEKIALELANQGIELSFVRAFARHIAAMAEYAELDKNGRINLPQNLCRFADLNNAVTVVGIINCLEVWNPQTLAEINSQAEQNVNAVAEKYGRLIRHTAQNTP